MAAPVDRRLLGESRNARTHMALACVLGVLSAVLILAQAALLAFIIERSAMHHATLSSLRGELTALAGVLTLRAVGGGAFELSGRWGAARIMSELRGRLVRRLMLESPGQRPERSGELATTAVNGVDALEAYFAGYLPQLILASVVPVAVIAWVLVLDPITAAILAMTVPVLILFMILIGRGARSQAEGRWRALSLLGAHFLDVVRGLATLRAYNRASAQERTLAEVGEGYRSETMATLRIAFLSALVLELCAMIGTALLAATIGVQLVQGALGLRAGLTVLLLAPELYGPLRLVGQQFHASADAGAASQRIFAALDTPAAVLAGSARRVPDPAREPIAFAGVTYEYPRRAGRALDGLDLQLEPGTTTALAGASGAGKSTVARLLLRLDDPAAGSLACGGVELRELDPVAWRAQIAWVAQRPTILSATVAENIALYAPGAERGEILRAARAANAEEFVGALPEGLDTPLGEGARRLSAGQAQRIALARAFLADRPLLLLDEPTAHLDGDSVEAVCEAIVRLAAGRTTLLIAHHPLLSGLADAVLEMDHGRMRAATRIEREVPSLPQMAHAGVRT
ncbi:MAG TPA: thiol reductant ABC exporter subunit CydD [Solirubrobacteraceae bacterium]